MTVKGHEISFMDGNVFVKARFGLGKGLMKYAEWLMIEPDGYLGELEEGRVELTVEVHDPNIHGFTIQPGKARAVVPKADEDEKLRKKLTKQGVEVPEMPNKRYVLNVAVKDNYGRGFYTQYPSDSIGFLWVKGGIVEYWRIAVVEQGGKFFLVNEKVYESALYIGSNDDKLHAFHLKLEQWPSMMEFIRGRVDKSVATIKLSNVPAKSSGLDPAMPQLDNIHGIVEWFSKAEGVGAIRMELGMVRFHYSEIITENRFASLEKGTIVTYERVDAPTDVRSNFEYEAFGLKAV